MSPSRAESGISSCEMKAVPQLAELGIGEFFDLMGGIAAFDVGTEGPSLDGLGEDHGRCSGELGRQVVGGVDLAIVEASPPQRPDFLVGPVLHESQRPRVLPEEVFTDVGAIRGLVPLVLAVDGVVHDLDEGSFVVGGEQRIPTAAPDHFDHVPAGAPETASSS